MKDAKNGASALEAGREFHTGMDRGRGGCGVGELNSYESVEVEICLSFMECLYLVFPVVEVKYSSALTSSKSLIILYRRVSCNFALRYSSDSHCRNSSIVDTLLVFRKRFVTYPAALRCIISTFRILSLW